MNRQGFVEKIWIVLILGLVLGGIICVYFIWGITAPLVSSHINQITNTVIVATGNGTASNLSNAATTAGSIATGTTGQAEWIGYSLLVILFIGFIAIAMYARTYPWLTFVWIGVMFILVLISIILTVSYQTIASSNGVVGAAYSQWQTNDFLMRNLPMILGVIGLLGGAILFMLVSRGDSGSSDGGSPVV